MNAERLMLIGGCVAFAVTIYWVRGRKLRERYAIGWIFVALALLMTGLFPHAIMRMADATRLSYPSAVLFVSLAAIYTFSFFVSVSLARLYGRNMRLAQELALVEHRLRELERAAAGACTISHE